jgi:hypothetical protein
MKTLFKIIIPLLILAGSSCTKDKKYQYEVTDVNVTQEGTEKTNRKSTTEFISIAYADVYGTNIPQSKLVNLSVAYSSFGDLKVIEQKIISNFLNDPAAIIPSLPSVNGDTSVFIVNTYKKFYNRTPNEFEKHFWKELIRTNAGANPTTIYFAMMTSDEYRFY